MTQCSRNGLNLDSVAEVRSGELAGDLGEVLKLTLYHTLRLLDDVPRLPRTLRVRAGDVAVDVEWDQQQAVAPTVPVGRGEAPPEPDLESARSYLASPTVGVFYRAPEPGAAPFIAEGETVVAGQQVGIVEAMKLMIPVEADQAGRVVEVLKDDGEAVEYGERLFALEPTEPASKWGKPCSGRY